VWHRHKITRKYEEIYHDSKGRRQRRTRTETLSDYTSTTAFFVEDATGKMVIRPGKHEVIGAEKILDRFDVHDGGGGNRLELGPLRLNLGRGDGTIGFKREEWVVRPGSRFYVHGEAADANGRLAVLRSENNNVLGFGIGSGVAAVAGVVLLVIGIIR
jgi:hypothetical protein